MQDRLLGAKDVVRRPRQEEAAMKMTSIKSLERIARDHGLGTLLVGGLLVIFYLAGHGTLYEAFRVV